MLSHWIVPALAASALALPQQQQQQLRFSPPVADSLAIDLSQAWQGLVHSKPVGFAAEGVRKFSQQVRTDGIDFELIQHAEFPTHSLRMKEPRALCDTSSKQYSGYLDIADDAHLFYWFFESRSKTPEKDPLVLWLNGGPGCSSTTGLLFELGPCAVANGGLNTTFNPHSWTESANVIFLDSPVQVGYSYGSKTVSNSQDTAEDVYAFLQLFLEKFPKFQKGEFHLAGESYFGTYAPNIASVIHKHNLNKPTPSALHVPLASVLIGNGLTDAYTQFASMPEWSCSKGGERGNPYGPIFDEATCQSMQSKVGTCQRLTEYCYKMPSRFVAGPIQQANINPYDIRRTCDRNGEDGPLCYKQMQWIETYMNQPEVRKELGASPDRDFESCNMQINQAFQLNGDVAHNTAGLIPELLDAGIRFLIYAGSADFMCNSKGNLAWTNAMDWTHASKYRKADLIGFKSNGKKAGHTKAVSPNGGAGLFRYLEINEAGHMVPYDQPEVSLDFFTRWIRNESYE
ncbi:hypothetical protein Rhopal_000343-T1 [Rhodotorula paludigena]|uniref:Carboxypeptidase n=1 Tax=Rhodotorula paludigena TaxID=86838 RepID=A0AAV5GDF5_9BASI|nr:hypothetical protein Rhopal_000343-T1 [Rhodotorula paludigena]